MAIKHLAIIPDGNRRYARKLGTKIWLGHVDGRDNMERIVESVFKDFKIPVFTVYAFSKQNFNRPAVEKKMLMELFVDVFRRLARSERIHDNKIRIKAVGELSLLPQNLLSAIADAEAATSKYKKRTLNIAIAYDGRQEIVDAVKKLVHERKPINEKTISGSLYFGSLPAPDLIIRTSGEQRISGFLLWNSTYAELYFSKKLWPEFTKDDLAEAIRSYNSRNRRFGH